MDVLSFTGFDKGGMLMTRLRLCLCGALGSVLAVTALAGTADQLVAGTLALANAVVSTQPG